MRLFDPSTFTPPCTGVRSRHLAADRVCYCFSDSEASTTDQKVAATDAARAVSGSNNSLATDKAQVTTLKDVKAPVATGKSTAIGTVTVNSGLKIESNAKVGNVTINGGADALASLGASLQGAVHEQSETLTALLSKTQPFTTPAVPSAGDAGAKPTPAQDAAATADADAAKKKSLLSVIGVIGALLSIWYFFKRSK